LFDNYKQETFRLFEIEPPDPDLESADPEAESSEQNLKEPGKLEPPNQ
jgi:hypothetical protein